MTGRAERVFAAHPVVAAAMAAHGLDPARLPWTACEASDDMEVDAPSGRDRPHLRLHDDGSASVRWWNDGEAVSYVLEADGYAVATLERRRTPETVLAAMAGRTLAEVVDLPGADATTIVEAVNSRSFASDPEDTRMSVVRTGDEPVPAETPRPAWMGRA